MSTIAVGKHRLDRVHEMVDTSFAAASFLPDLDPEVMASHMDWLAPTHYFPDTGHIVLSMHSWLVRTDKHTVLIDACVGNGKDRMPRAHWHNLDTPYLQRLADAGVAPEEIDFVMCTHMHGDHVGWNTVQKDGRWVPTFPNARYIFGAIEYDYWLNNPDPSPIRRNAFNDSVLPVVESGQAVMVDDGYELDDALSVVLAPGHTPGNATIRLKDGDDVAMFAGDAIHHPIQIWRPDWSTSACTDPVQSRASRFRLLETCCEHNALLVPAHFAPPHAGHVREEGDGFRFEWLKV
ncbi:MAG: MBL fold metallo-hydrolase [Chromatiales bacterium]|jgi:glyoxylase-like metal-dependent hydrolase (beta-lactamase superfamily II)|nr:MBL fold metallo-hydrolase [Chromatiales bacterium]